MRSPDGDDGAVALASAPRRLDIERLGRAPFRETYAAMQRFTANRGADTPDAVWLVEHPPVYTVGQAGRDQHLPRRADIPLERIDRGGQITYHGPGQSVAYVLVDLARRGLKVRDLVRRLEAATIDLLAGYGIAGGRRDDAPGVYVGGAKIAALGLRVRRGCSYHGIALNVKMDLAPFAAIDPCGYPGLAITQLADRGVDRPFGAVAEAFARHIISRIES